jgi:small subunit ribosomal protein S5
VSREREHNEEHGLEDTVVKIYRTAKVVKGGRRFGFAALVVVGDRNGTVGIGYGKAKEVPLAVEKGIKEAKKHMNQIQMKGRTLPHLVIGRHGASKIVLVPAAPGTGVIAGNSARAVLELAGIGDALSKCYGSTSPKNVVKATMNALMSMRTREQIEALRGIKLA